MDASPTIPIRGRSRTRANVARRLLVMLALAGPAGAAAQTTADPPFAVGERLTYVVRVSRVGTVGRGSMVVEGPEDVRGVSTLILRFDFSTRVGPVRAVNHTESWLDPARMTSLRFHKHERHPFSSHEEQVELYPEQRRWEGADGQRGESPTDAPLDELSFLYFIRTLPLSTDTLQRLDRHFDAARNPTTLRVVGRETITTAAGEFRTIVVEMRVKDARRYRGEGVIRIHYSDDAYRLPVRIESAAPIVGKATLTLESHTHPPAHFATQAP